MLVVIVLCFCLLYLDVYIAHSTEFLSFTFCFSLCLCNLVPRLFFLHSSLKVETLVNAGHVAPRFWEPACEVWWVVLFPADRGLRVLLGKRRRRDLCPDPTRFLSRMCKNYYEGE